jgi:hypothetical protein
VRDTGTGDQTTVSAPVTLINNGAAAPPVSISANPTSVAGTGNDGSAATTSTTFTVSGGVGPFTISVSGGPGNVVSPTGSGRSHSTNFTATNIPPGGGTIVGNFTATVHDGGTGNYAYANVSATFFNFGGGPLN